MNETNTEIKEAFPEGTKFREVVFKPTLMDGDIVRLKPNISSWDVKCRRSGFFSNRPISENTWKASKVFVQLNDDGTQTTYIGWLDEQVTDYTRGWIEESPADLWEVVERAEEPKEQLCYLPFSVDEIVWWFPNHLYDSFTPQRYRVFGYRYSVGMANIDVGLEEWTFKGCCSTDNDVLGFYGRKHYCIPFHKTYYDDFRKDDDGKWLVKSYEQQYYGIQQIKEIFSDETNFIKFANKTYAKDAFASCKTRHNQYEQLMSDIGKTLSDLKNASKKACKPLKRKSKSTTKETKKKSVVKDILSGLTEAQKKEMLKLLSK